MGTVLTVSRKKGEILETTTQVVEIKSINAWTAFKLGLVAYLTLGLLFGIMVGIMFGIIGGVAGMEELQNTPFAGIVGVGGGFVGGIIFGLIWGVFYGIAGAVGMTFMALLYDLFAMIVGGIKITLKS